MNDMRSMLNSSPARQPEQLCAQPPRDTDTIDFQLDRMADITTAIRYKVASIAAKIDGETFPENCDRQKPDTAAGAIAMLAADLEDAAKNLERINGVMERQLGNWRLE
jgi:hypothetical protein